MSNEEIVGALEKLIETCKDGEYGFRSCAEYTKTADLQALFKRRAEDCERASHELQTLVVKLGGDPETGGTTAGAVHRGWVAVRATLSNYTDEAMLSECERGEDAALERYRDVLRQPLPAEILAIIQRQYEGAKRNHDEVRNLRDRLRRAV
jgi:uncharacterized protein (TIGR02284 family)